MAADRNRVNGVLFATAVALAVGAAACDSTVEPMGENAGLIYSIHGFLDASADTQWVRVMPVRESLVPQSQTLDAEVTLKNLETGNRVVMNDSLFQFVGRASAWNFWTDKPISPGGEYLLRAERSDGKSSEAAVSMPEEFPPPVVNLDELVEEDQEILFDQVFIEGVDTFAYLEVLHHVMLRERDVHRYYRFPVTDELVPTGDPDFRQLALNRRGFDPAIALDMDPLLTEPLNRFNLWDHVRVEKRQIHIVAGGPEWVDFDRLELVEIELPDGVSNVENGLGYVGGVISMTVPYRECRDPETNELVACQPEEPLPLREMINLEYQD